MRQKNLWSSKWSLVDDNWQRRGGQGKVRLLCPFDDPDAARCVLKELHNQTDIDRRRRMRREAIALETLPHPAVPRLLDHNTESYADTDVDLYAVLEFIPGPTLQEFVDCHGAVTLKDAIKITLTLLSVLETYHESGCGHRDIKPDNIILRDTHLGSPVLLDFGLSFNLEEAELTDTPDWQQVGNRFLALPEHAAFSTNKRDLRSDLTFCVGILFFALTGKPPATLTDQDGALPHQRPERRAAVDALPEHQRLPLLTTFDIGFSHELARRWQSIGALREQLSKVKSIMEKNDAGLSIADIQAWAAAKSGNKAIEGALNHVRAQIKAATVDAVTKLGEGFKCEIEERITTMADMSTWIRCGIRSRYDGMLINTYYLITALGSELVVAELPERAASRGDVVARLPLDRQDDLDDLQQIVQRAILQNLRRKIAGPQSLLRQHD